MRLSEQFIEDGLALLRQLIQCPSVNSRIEGGTGEYAVAQVLKHWLQSRGVSSDIQQVGPRTWNLVAHVSTSSGSPRIVLCSHLDTVSAPYKDAFIAKIRHGFVSGRGSVDAKASVALFATLLARAVEYPAAWNITLAAVGDEEVSGSGARYFLERDHDFDMAIIGEPTNNRLVTAHKGVLRFDVILSGRAAHSSVPDQGINSLAGGVELIQHFLRWHNEAEWPNDPVLGQPTLTPTRFVSGIGDNIVPSEARITFDRRTVPPEDANLLFEKMVAQGQRVRLPTELRVEWRKGITIPWFMVPSNASIVRLMQEALIYVGMDANPIGMAYGSDAWQFAKIGIECVIFGPGNIYLAHSKEEALLIDEWCQASNVLQRLLWTPSL
ncbi:MAG: M20/M25/M40 family metallo-hydrolase [Firmicutes bacterium]|nr:M20/M25/M40 family metallo-hydrolase [Bacillota bacterium]